MQGSLSRETLPGVIRSLYVSRKSGILHLSREQISKRIYFKKGSMIFAQSEVNEDRLGEFLIRAGRIKRSDYELASKVMKDTGRRFGQTIVEMGFMPPEEMLSMVIEQIRAIIYSLFAWEAGEYHFEEREDPVDEDIVLNLSTADIIMEGIRRMKDAADIRRGLGDLNGVLRHSENPLLLYQKISLTPAEGFVLSRVDGLSSVAEIAAISPLGEEETIRCIYSLVSAGVLDLEGPRQRAAPRRAPEPVEIPRPEAEALAGRDGQPEPARSGPTPEEQEIREDISAKHASLATANHYELLGLTPNASDPEIKKAYYVMAKKYHPDRHHSPYLEDVHGLLEELFVKITQSYELLSNPLERRRYDSSHRVEAPRGEVPAHAPTRTTAPPAGGTAAPASASDEKMAEIRYREGKRHFTEMHYFDAIQALRDAVRLDPVRPSYHRLLAQSLAKNPHWRKEAEEHFLKAIELDGFDSDSYLGLGEIYELVGMATRAEKMYRQALEVDPQNELAREKLLGKAGGSPVEGLKGFFRRRKKE